MEPQLMKEWGVNRVETNVVYAMYSGLALLLDVYHPEDPNGYGSVHISGSGWSAPLGPDASPLKEAGHVACEVYTRCSPLTIVRHPVFVTRILSSIASAQ